MGPMCARPFTRRSWPDPLGWARPRRNSRRRSGAPPTSTNIRRTSAGVAVLPSKACSRFESAASIFTRPTRRSSRSITAAPFLWRREELSGVSYLQSRSETPAAVSAALAAGRRYSAM